MNDARRLDAKSGRSNWGRAAAVIGVAAALAAGSLTTASTANANSATPDLSVAADPSVWGTNGRVMEIATIGDRAFIGGDFDYVGPSVGSTALVNSSTGVLAETAKMANGQVNAAVADGSGGYYIGGSFTNLAGVPRKGLAHIQADGRVNRDFKAQVSGTVYALARSDSGTLYVGGKFTQVAGSPATNLAAVDGATGLRVAGWNASPNSTVYALATQGSSVYAGGSFTSVNGSSKSRMVRLSAATGSVDFTFGGAANSTVYAAAVSVDGSTVYAGGLFGSAYSPSTGWVSRSRLAAYSTSNGQLSAWQASADGTVKAIAVDQTNSDVYVGGQFTSLGGEARVGLGVVTAAGQVGSFDAQLSGCHEPHNTKYVYGLVPCVTDASAFAIEGDTLYVGGNFGKSGSTDRHNAVAFSMPSGMLTDWNPVPGARVSAIVPTASGIALGGQFTSVGGVLRKGLAVIDVATGQADPGFRADVQGMVLDLLPTDDNQALYVAGDFPTIGGVNRSYVAKVDATTGAIVTAFNARPTNEVIQLAQAGSALYLGGKFQKVNGVTRVHAAKVDATTGATDPTWVANTDGPSGRLRANGMVEGIQVTPDGAKVFLAGPFTTVNGQSVSGGIVALNGTDGARVGSIGGVQGCGGIGPWINRIYLSPDGTRLYGGDVCPDYIYQWDTVNLGTPSNPTGLLWRSWCNGGMQGRLETNGHFYFGSHGGNRGAGGLCSSYPGGPSVVQDRFAVFDSDNGHLLPISREFDTPMGVWSYGVTSQGLLVGGDFTFAGDRTQPQQGFALFRGTP